MSALASPIPGPWGDRPVLVVDDHAGARDTFTRALRAAGFEVAAVGTGTEALRRAAARLPAAVILDANLPDMTGEQVLRRLRADPWTSGTPIIVVTGDAAEARRITSFGIGASDYLTKPVSLRELVVRVRAHVRTQQDWLARIDDTLDRRRRLARALAGLEPGRPLPEIERSLDSVLRSVLAVDELTVRPFVEGGDQRPWFDRPGAATTSTSAAERARGPGVVQGPDGSVVRVPLESGGGTFATVEVVTSRPDEVLTALVDLAPQLAMLLQRAVDEDERSRRDRRLVEEALSPGAIAPVFQPVIDMCTGRVAGFEGLSRFAGGRSPEHLFRSASRAGLATELEIRAIDGLLAAAGRLPEGTWVSLNVSVPTLLAGDLSDALAGTSRPVLLEVTEHELISDYEAVRRAVERLPGVELGVDDTGSGYASLRHVFELRPSVVKLDRSWIAGIDRDPVRRALVSGLLHFTEELGALLLGEGVEEASECEVLGQLGVPLAQGYLFGPPAPVERWSGGA